MKRVAVIGAGAAGLAALRSLGRHKDKLEYVAFEISDRVGGTWILNDPFKPTSMYNQLRTNLPKEVMGFPGFPFSNEVYASFVDHPEVLKYLESLAKHYQLHQHIRFRHRVEEVDPVINVQGETEWKVTVRDCQSGHLHTEMFDYVLVCNGHYVVPLLPQIEGHDTFTGKILHVCEYRCPQTYKNNIVLMLGAGPSGLDVTMDLSPHVSKIYLSHNKNRLTYNLPDNTEQVAGVERISNGDIILKDGNIVHADVIIYATGYRYTFPFLSKKCHPEVKEGHVQMIYRLMVDIRHPSLFYIGLNNNGVSFPRFCYQTDYAVACILGEISLPSAEEMEREYNERYKTIMRECGHPKYYHDVKDYQWQYLDMLAREACLPPFPSGMVQMYKQVHVTKNQNMCTFKDAVYRLSDDQLSFVTVEKPA